MISRFFKDSKAVRIVAAILAIIWMVIIFSFSNQDADASGAVSQSVSYRMVEASANFLHLEWAGEKIQAVADRIENGVRKAAHMTEYAILAFFIGTAVNAWGWWKNASAGIKFPVGHIINAIICMLYAASDEWHQTFIPGRNGAVKDVFIDAAGSVIAIVVIIGITSLVRKRKMRMALSSEAMNE